MTSSATALIGDAIAKNERLVVLPQAEFSRVKKYIKSGKIFAGYAEIVWCGKKHKIPTYQMLGKWADDLDNMVEEGLAEYAAGQYIKSPSLKVLLSKSKRGEK